MLMRYAALDSGYELNKQKQEYAEYTYLVDNMCAVLNAYKARCCCTHLNSSASMLIDIVCTRITNIIQG